MFTALQVARERRFVEAQAAKERRKVSLCFPLPSRQALILTVLACAAGSGPWTPRLAMTAARQSVGKV